MKKVDLQLDAVSNAVRYAVETLGINTLLDQGFFGLKRKNNDSRKAA